MNVVPLRRMESAPGGSPPDNVRQLRPRITEKGMARLLSREQAPCGPETLRARVVAVAQAQRQDEKKLLVGALEDLAACALAYATRERQLHGIKRRA